MICSRCGHQGLSSHMKECPNCGLQLNHQRAVSATGTFRALSSRRKMLTQRHYALPFPLGEEIFGRFKARDLLGQGPIGVVYQVTDERGDLWALKVLHERWREGLDLDAFQGELLSLEPFKREGLCSPHEVIIHERGVGVLLPLQSGLTLRKLMSLRKNAQRAFELDELTQLLQGVHAALAPLHKEGLAHGDVKPENLFVSAGSEGDEQQQITLSDARLSVAIGLESAVKAQKAHGHGHMVAPELSRGELTPASDVYSLGVLLFEALSKQSAQGGLRPLAELFNAPSLKPLDELLTKAVSEEPKERYQHIDELMSAFVEVSVGLAHAGGSPFDAKETNPGVEVSASKVSSSAQASAQLTEGTNAALLSDPLLGVAAEPHASPLTSSEGLEALTVPLSSVSAAPMLMGDATPPPLPLEVAVASAPAAPPPLPPASLSALELEPKAPAAPALDPLSELEELSPAQERSPSAELSPRQERAPQPLVLNPSSRGPWLLNSTLGFALSAVFVVGSVASGVFYLLSDEPSTTAPAVVSSSEPSADELKAQAEAEAKAQAEAEAKAQAEAEAKAQAEAEAKAQAEAEAKAQAEAEAKAQAEAKNAKVERQQSAVQATTQAKRAERERQKEEREAAAQAKRAERERQKEEREAKAQAKRAERERQKEEREAAAQAKRAERERQKEEREAKAKAEREAKAALKTNVETQAKRAPTSAPKKGEVVETSGELRCPAGMIARSKKRFPRGSLRGSRVKGAAAVKMAKEGHAYCIDAYEYPGKGQLPKVNINLSGAQALCAQVNKRLCTDQEWRRACGGTFPYGKNFNGDRCNTEDSEGEERKLSPSGSFKRCSSGGVYDMSGNVSEWTSDNTVRGGYYASADEDAACGGGGRRSPSSKRPYIGFRCCADFK